MTHLLLHDYSVHTLAIVISLPTIATVIVIALSIANAAWCWKSNKEENQRIDIDNYTRSNYSIKGWQYWKNE